MTWNFRRSSASKHGPPPGLDKTLSELADVTACYDTNWGATSDAIDVAKIPDIKVDQDLADALATERYLKVAGQKADQNIRIPDAISN